MSLQEKLDQRQSERMENEALKNAKEIAKKKSKDTLKQVVIHAVKVAVIPMFLLLLKVIAIVLAVAAIISLFSIVVSGDTGEAENINGGSLGAASIQPSDTDITTDIWKLTEEQIISFIESYETSNEDLRTELTENASKIKEWQDNYGYSASFFISVAFEEGITDFEAFLTEMNTNGQEWKDAGYKTITEIAEDYVGDETTEEWGNNIINKMRDVSIAAGIIETGEEVAFSGDGYDSIYVSNSGKRYRNYQQSKGSYASYIFGYDLPISSHGCCLTSMTIIISGYKDMDIDPKTAVIASNSGGDEYYPQQTLNYYGIQSSRTDSITDSVKENIKNTIETTGKPAVIRVTGKENGGSSTFTSTEHWIALLDYNSVTDEFYVSNPNNKTGFGWMNATKVLTSCTNYIQITN